MAGPASQFSYGWQEAVFAAMETAYGAPITPAPDDAIRVLRSQFAHAQERAPRRDKHGSRSVLAMVTGREAAAWQIEKYLVPSGMAGTAPDDGVLWRLLFGAETVTPDASVAYGLTAEPSASCSLFRYSGNVMESLAGAVPTAATLRISGTSPATVAFSGFAGAHGHAGVDALLTRAGRGASSVDVTDADRFSAGGVIQLGSQTGRRVTGVVVSPSGVDAVSFTPALSATLPKGATVFPYEPDQTTAGAPVHGILGAFTVDGSTVYVTEAMITIENGLAPRNDEFGDRSASGVRAPGRRAVTFALELYLRRDALAHLGKAKRTVSRDLALTVGVAAGSKVQIDLDRAEFEIPQIALPQTEEAVLRIEGTALGASGEDEIKVTFL